MDLVTSAVSHNQPAILELATQEQLQQMLLWTVIPQLFGMRKVKHTGCLLNNLLQNVVSFEIYTNTHFNTTTPH